MAQTTRTVRWRVVQPDGTPAESRRVWADLLAGDATPLVDTGTILESTVESTSTVEAAADWEDAAGGAGGWVEFDLTVQADIAPDGTRWQIRVPGSGKYQLVELVEGDGTPIDGRTLLDADPTDPAVVSSLSYVHIQATPDTVWTIPHGMGRFPGGITVVDSAGDVVIGFDLVHDSTNQLTLTFSAAFSGTAYLS